MTGGAVSLRSLVPYLLIFVAFAGYLFFRIQTAMKAPRRPTGVMQWHERGRARRRLRVARSWDDLGHHPKKDGEK
jgi:hypothetical protein